MEEIFVDLKEARYREQCAYICKMTVKFGIFKYGNVWLRFDKRGRHLACVLQRIKSRIIAAFHIPWMLMAVVSGLRRREVGWPISGLRVKVSARGISVRSRFMQLSQG